MTPEQRNDLSLAIRAVCWAVILGALLAFSYIVSRT